ncbi:MAG: phage tail protein [Ferruginibacter sp.]
MEGTIAEIRYFAGNFAPRNWAYCNGSIYNIASNTALFSLLGTTYGGNGQTTFAIPDFQGRAGIGWGQGPGLSSNSLGEKGGSETVTLVSSNIPAHNHSVTGSATINVNDTVANSDSPVGLYPGVSAATAYGTVTDNTTMANAQSSLAVANAGSGLPLSNQQPYLGMNFIICLFGIFPSRN